jgi:hypothetical protein
MIAADSDVRSPPEEDMRRVLQFGPNWWMSPTRESIGNLALILPAIIAFLLALLLPWLRSHAGP